MNKNDTKKGGKRNMGETQNVVEITYNAKIKKWVIRAYLDKELQVYDSAKENEGLDFMAALTNCMIQVREKEKRKVKK